jgi:hypothetical protein
MDRAEMAASMTADRMGPCDGCDTAPASPQSVNNLCVVHCTADLQIFGFAPSLICNPSSSAVLTVLAIAPAVKGDPCRPTHLPGGPPHRIVLHSFLI